MKNKTIVKIICVFFVCAIFSVVCLAVDTDSALPSPGIDEILDIIPDEAKDKLPSEIESGEVGIEAFGFDYIIGMIKSAASEAMLSGTVSVSAILGVLLISSAASLHFRDTLGGRTRDAVSLISSLSIGCYALTAEAARTEEIEAFAYTISSFTGAMTPMLSAMHAATANTLGASVASSGFILYSSAIQFLSAYIFIPMYKAALAFSVISAVLPAVGGVGPIASYIKKTFTTLITAAAMIFVTVLSYQTYLAAAADSVAARGIKFAVSSSVPIVGGVLSDSLRTLCSGMSVIKSGAGTIGIVVVLILTLPIIFKLFISGMIYGITAFAAGLLGCDREASLLSSLQTALGLAGAVVAVIVVVFIIATALFIKTAPAMIL